MSTREKVIGVVMLLTIVSWAYLSLERHPVDRGASDAENQVAVKHAPAQAMDETDPLDHFQTLDLDKHLKLKPSEAELSSLNNPFARLPGLEPNPEAKAGLISTDDKPLSSASLKVTGIAGDEKGRFALINNMILREGDKIEGYTVEKITRDKVILRRGRRRRSLGRTR